MKSRAKQHAQPASPPKRREQGHDDQTILLTILNSALASLPLGQKCNQILDYLTSQTHLHFDGRAALFAIDKTRESLILITARKCGSASSPACSNQRYDACHCGKSIAACKLHYFTTRPPLMGLSDEELPFFGGYCLPIFKADQRLGVLAITTSADHVRSERIDNLLNGIANILAVTLEGQQMNQQLVELVHDQRSYIASLKEEKKFTESIIQGLNHGLLVTDNQGLIRKANAVAHRILRPFTADSDNSDSLEGVSLYSLLGDTPADRLLTCCEAGDLEANELPLQTPSGENIILGFSSVERVDGAGSVVGMIISISDISELKYVRREMEKMNRLSTVAEIASAVAHEVRNPLAGIKIMAQSIEEEAGENSDQLECSQRIIRQVDRLNQLLSDFFSYARPAEPDKRPTRLPPIIAETIPLIHNRLMKNQIMVEEDIPANLPSIIADPHQVQQVFLNLFLNAIDAIRAQGEISIQLCFADRRTMSEYRKRFPGLMEEQPCVVAFFRDNGSGMTPLVAEQVFEPFFTTKTSGAGLGLSIVYRTLKENDASIFLETGEGAGTTFTIFFKAHL